MSTIREHTTVVTEIHAMHGEHVAVEHDSCYEVVGLRAFGHTAGFSLTDPDDRAALAALGDAVQTLLGAATRRRHRRPVRAEHDPCTDSVVVWVGRTSARFPLRDITQRAKVSELSAALDTVLADDLDASQVVGWSADQLTDVVEVTGRLVQVWYDRVDATVSIICHGQSSVLHLDDTDDREELGEVRRVLAGRLAAVTEPPEHTEP